MKNEASKRKLPALSSAQLFSGKGKSSTPNPFTAPRDVGGVLHSTSSMPPSSGSSQQPKPLPPSSSSMHGSSSLASPHVSPGLRPTQSPRPPTPGHWELNSPHMTPSSPRLNLIPSVGNRLRSMIRSGRLSALLKNARLHLTPTGVKRVPGYGGVYGSAREGAGSGVSSLWKTKERKRKKTYTVLKPGESEAAAQIDAYVRRQEVLRLLDSEMIVQGIVFNKRDQCVVVKIRRAFPFPSEKAPDKTGYSPSARQGSLSSPSHKMGPPPSSGGRTPEHLFLSPSHPHSSGASYSLLGGAAAAAAAGGGESPRNAPGGGATKGGAAMLHDLEEYEVYGVCYISELRDSSTPEPTLGQDDENSGGAERRDRINRYTLGDVVKAVIVSVDVHSEVIYLSLNNDRLHKRPQERSAYHSAHSLGRVNGHSQSRGGAAEYGAGRQSTPHGYQMSPYGGQHGGVSPMHNASGSSPSPWSVPGKLGLGSMGYGSFSSTLATPYGMPLNFSSFKSQQASSYGAPRKPKQVFLDILRSSKLFKNPNGLALMADAYQVFPYGSCLYRPQRAGVGGYKALRRDQNSTWATSCVARGVAIAKAGDPARALDYYKQALEIDPTHKAAFIARGAAYVLQGRLKESVAEFQAALKICPGDGTATKYLAAARVRLQQMAQSREEEEAALAASPISCAGPPSGRGGARSAGASSSRAHSRSNSSRASMDRAATAGLRDAAGGAHALLASEEGSLRRKLLKKLRKKEKKRRRKEKKRRKKERKRRKKAAAAAAAGSSSSSTERSEVAAARDGASGSEESERKGGGAREDDSSLEEQNVEGEQDGNAGEEGEDAIEGREGSAAEPEPTLRRYVTIRHGGRRSRSGEAGSSEGEDEEGMSLTITIPNRRAPPGNSSGSSADGDSSGGA